MRKWVSLFTILMFVSQTYAEKVKVNGLYYNLVEKAGIAEVTFPSRYSEYSGNIVVPDSIEYDGLKYVVAEIGDNAFTSTSINSVKIPISIKK